MLRLLKALFFLGMGGLLLGAGDFLWASFPLLSVEKAQPQEKFQEKPQKEGAFWRQERVLMGTVVRLELVSRPSQSPEEVRKAVQAAFFVAEEWANRVSCFDVQSELSQLNERRISAVEVSSELAELLEKSLFLARKTDSFFDPTLGAPMRLWRKSKREGRLPQEADLAKAREASGWQKVELSARNEGNRLGGRKRIDGQKRGVKKSHPRLLWDLGGIAKGFILDKMAEELRKRGFASFLLSTTSDFLAGEPPLGEEGWLVSYPSGKRGEKKSLFLKNAALSTSGTQYQSFSLEGKTYAHVLCPQTGLGSERQGSCSVWAPTATQADAWASACFLEPSLRPSFAECWKGKGERERGQRKGVGAGRDFWQAVSTSFVEKEGRDEVFWRWACGVFVLGREEEGEGEREEESYLKGRAEQVQRKAGEKEKKGGKKAERGCGFFHQLSELFFEIEV